MEKLRAWERVGYSLFAIAGIAAVIGIGVAFGLGKSDWAAWVQAVGAIIAVGVAIWVPARQRQLERNDLWQKEKEADIVQWARVFAVVADTAVLHEYHLNLSGRFVRGECRQDAQIDDIFHRIRNLETTEIKHVRTEALLVARRALYLTQTEFARPWAQHEMINLGERDALEKRTTEIQELQTRVLDAYRKAEQKWNAHNASL